MTIQTIISDVCAAIGVAAPSGTVFLPANVSRTMYEMMALANEMAQRIAYDTRDWTILKKLNVNTGDGTTTQFLLPADYKRLLLTSNIYSSTAPLMPLRYISDTDQWYQRRLMGAYGAPIGEWHIIGNQLNVYPAPAAGSTIGYYYLHNAPIQLFSGGYGPRFQADNDVFAIDERLLKLGMIWAWKSGKGGSYAEDLANYEDALARVQGADKPSPIITGRQPISHDAQVAYPWPAPTH